MNKILLLSVTIFCAAFFSGCEKDDICGEGTETTPRLIVEFYDAANPTLLKNVTNLTVVGEGQTDTLATFTAVSKIKLPLRTTATATVYKFTINSLNAAADNEDRIQFNYTTNDIFVSRACGYKTVYVLDPTTPFVQTDAATPDLLWMQNITVTEPNINTETDTHVKIYF